MGQRIAKLMEIKNLNQSEMARILGVSRMTVSQWVNGTSEPRPENLVMLAELLGTDVHYLVFGPSRQPDGGFPSVPSPSGNDTGIFRVPVRRKKAT